MSSSANYEPKSSMDATANVVHSENIHTTPDASEWSSTSNDKNMITSSEQLRPTISSSESEDRVEQITVPPKLLRTISTGIVAPYIGPTAFNLNDEFSIQRPRSASLKSEKTTDELPSHMVTASRVSTDAHGFTYPEGGAQAWLCVFGSFCGMMSSLGMMNTIGTIHSYITENQLRGTSDSKIGWIFGLYTFLSFFCGIQIGPVFDAKGPRWLIASASVLVLITWFALGFCTQYWHFIVVFGICGGVGTSLMFTPAVTAVGHHFLRRRALCTGMAAVGGSMGGVVFPLILQALLPKVGFAWATRVIGFISIGLLIMANLFIRARLPPRPATREAIMPDLKIFRNPVLSLTTAGIFCVEWGLFIPLTYLTSYALSKGVDVNLSYQIIAIFNVGSCFGRWLPGFLADKVGRFNTMIVTIALCLLSTFAIWIPAGSSVGAIIAYAVIFGFSSGAGISLTPVCVSQLCKVEDYGRYYATTYTIVSFACLTGIPIAGSLVTAADGAYWGVMVFTGCSYALALAAFVAARILGAGWDLKKVF